MTRPEASCHAFDVNKLMVSHAVDVNKLVARSLLMGLRKVDLINVNLYN